MDRSSLPSDEGPERAILVGVRKPREPEWEVRDSLEELARLADSAGVVVVEPFLCRPREASPAFLIGSGKAQELAGRVAATGADVAIFDEDLSPAQGRNLEKAVGVRAVDRTQLILDIFAQRAQTSEGRLQVELAQLQYLLPRLRHLWTHLERQKGGIGLKGPGEQQLELDRRRIGVRLQRIRAQIEHVRARREELRRGRARHGWAQVCLVGYTNAGKSTLLNALSGAAVAVDDRLFATLDPTTRRIELPNHQAALLTDTVGFVRKLPHRLVEAFRATLEEVTEADALVHVVDASHPGVLGQVEAVRAVLRELAADAKPCLHALNKSDLPAARGAAASLARTLPRAVELSALRGEGLGALRAELADLLRGRHRAVRLRVPAAEGRVLALLRQSAGIESERLEGDVVCLEARIPGSMSGLVAPFRVGGAGEGGAPDGEGEG